MKNMKDSGIAWIGEIPDNWESARIGSLYKIRNQKVSDVDYPPLSVTMKGVLPQLENVAKTNAHDDRKLVKKGDFAINSRSDRRGSCGVSGYDGSVSLINIVLQPINEMNSIYYNWVFHTVEFADEFYKWGHGIVDDLWTTRWQDMKNIVIPQPAISEQKKIAEFLDGKCGEIDGLINDIKTQIETLEQYKRSVITEAVTKGLNKSALMKDSGIPWIGVIPENWGICPNKYVMKKVKRLCVERSDENILSLTMKGVVIRDLDAGGKMPTSFNGYQYVKKGNLLMCLFDIDVTPRCIGLVRNNGITSPAYSQFEVKNACANYYFYYYLMMDFTKELLHLSKNLRYSLTEEQFGAINTIVPPITEQQQIADYLDKKCAEIDKIISDKQSQIETLEEYKKSLIFEYVTGKKEVR